MLTWVDIETTGLDPRTGFILELGVIITDDFLVELDRRAWLIAPALAGRTPRPGLWNMSSYVTDMHTTSGLIEDVLMGGWPARDVEREAFEWISEAHGGHPALALMAGNSIHFDRSWIKMHMPALDDVFGYRMVDVSSIKELAARWFPGREFKVEGDKPRRALPDLEHSIAELRYYAGAFMDLRWAL